MLVGSDYTVYGAENGTTKLYYDGVAKLETISGGVTVTGNFNGTGNITATTDNGKLICGAGDDLQIYHDGTDNIILSDAPDLYIKTTSSETCARFGRNGGVDLYYDNGLRALTTANGFQVEQAAGVDVEFRLKNATNTNASATNYILSEHDGRTTAKIVFGRNNDANDFSAAAATTQGDIQFWTTNSGSLSKKGTFRNAGGLCFGTDTANANALDDYEQGVFTPTLRKSGDSTGEVSGTGAYTKIGNVVHAKICFANKACSNIPNGAVAEIQGLPFNAHHGTHTDEMAISGPMVEMGIAQRNGGIFRTTTATSYLRAYYMNNNSTWSVWYVDDFNNSGVYLIFGITYLTT
jgi:hypothetical protein